MMEIEYQLVRGWSNSTLTVTEKVWPLMMPATQRDLEDLVLDTVESEYPGWRLRKWCTRPVEEEV